MCAKSSERLYYVDICDAVLCEVTDTVRKSANKYSHQYLNMCEIQNLREKCVNKLSMFGLMAK